MFKVEQSEVCTLVSDDMATAVFGNMSLGNVDPRFSDYGAARTNQYRAMQALLGRDAVVLANLFVMEPSGEPGFAEASYDSSLATDGLITTKEHLVLCGNPADCEMISMYGPGRESNVLGLIHVGRRSAERKGHITALQHLCDQYDLTPDKTRLMFAPSIKPESYKFEDIDEAQKTDPQWLDYVTFGSDELWHIDVHSKVVDELIKEGIRPENIYESPIDVGADPNYFSHRQHVERGQTKGRNAVMVKLNNTTKLTLS